MSVITFKRHIFSEDTPNLLTHFFTSLPVMPEGNCSKYTRKKEDRTHESVLRNSSTTLSTMALAAANASIKIRAALALCAYFWFGTIKVTVANTSEYGSCCESSTKSNSVDKSSWENDDTTGHLSLHLQIKEGVGSVFLKSTTILHTTFNHIRLNFCMLVTIIGAIIICKEVWVVATLKEMCYIIPPLASNSISFAIMLPDTNTSQTFFDNIRSRDTVIKVIVGVSSTVPSVVGAQIEAHILSIKSLAVTLNSVINIHVGSEIGM
mmetsp:Transcript_13359/g.20791  ORF Transcript_13359/g.20791 Transcript_13359/m.20791 type:complete len:265 (-) Transcript_13359:747-1541(-)